MRRWPLQDSQYDSYHVNLSTVCGYFGTAEYAVGARLTAPLKRLLTGLRYERAKARWECAEDEYRSHGWPKARRIVVARRLIDQNATAPSISASRCA